MKDDDGKPGLRTKVTKVWTRRSFMAVLGVSAAVVAVRLPPEAERPRSVWNGKTRWIGHC